MKTIYGNTELSIRRRPGGFSLVEVVISTLIVGGLMVAAMTMLASASRSRQVRSAQRLGPALARQWMTEILQARYEELETVMEDAEVNGWRRRIKVEYVKPGDPDVVSAFDTGIKRITITATGPGGRSTSLVSLRSSISIYDRMPAAKRDYLRWVGAELQIGGNDRGRVTTGVNLLNRIPAP